MSKATALSREALAASAEETREEAPTTTASAIAAELAPLFQDTERVFDMARIAYTGVNAGIKGDDIAKATTKALALIQFPSNAKARAWAEATSVAQGGAKVSRTAIVQRASAWSDLVAAGVVPTPDAVAASYKLTTTGNSGDTRKALIESVAKMAQAKREVSYIRRATEALVELRRANRAKNAEAAATQSADDKAEAPTSEAPVLETAQEVAEYLRAISQRAWSKADAEVIAEALADASARLATF
jgi:hypothetical protein